MVTLKQFQKLSDTGRDINFTVITEIWITFTLNPQIILVTMLVLGMLWCKMAWVRMDFNKLDVLYLVLQVLDELSQLWFDIAFPYDEVFVLFSHNTQFYKIAISVEKINWFEQILPVLFLLINVLNQLRSEPEILSCNMAGNSRNIMSCIHVWLQGSKYQHTTLRFLINIARFNSNR